MNIIETKGLTKFYGASRGVAGLDLTVEEGAFFGFIGPNGAGKSTTIRVLLGLIRATSGSVRLFGMDWQRERKDILRRVGFLPSETMFYSGMRVGELLRLSARLRKRDCRAEAERLCGRLRLDPTKKIETLSLGNRKKVGIVCAMQHRPELYILDEPTSGLDPLMQREFFALLKERSREGATVFLSSHVLSEVQRHCDRAAIIRAGRLIACDTVSALAGTSARRVRLRGEADLTGLEGVRDLRREGEGASFLYSGDVQALLRVLARWPLADVTITEPDLEEVFLHDYGEGEERP